MEPAANRSQVDVLHASFQVLLENVLVPEYRLPTVAGFKDRTKHGNEMVIVLVVNQPLI